MDHFRSNASTGALYEMPDDSGLDLSTLQEFFDITEAQKHILDAAKPPVALDDDVDGPLVPDAPLCDGGDEDMHQDRRGRPSRFFRIVDLTPARRKTLPHWSGGGRRFGARHIAVSLHAGVVATVADTDVVCHVSLESASARAQDPITILSLDGVDSVKLESSLRQWTVDGFTYDLPLPGLERRDPEVSQILKRMFDEGCYGPETALDYEASPALLAMESENFVRRDGDGRWFLEEAAMKEIVMEWRGEKPEMFFKSHAEAGAERQPTAYECLKRLAEEGWTWERWKQATEGLHSRRLRCWGSEGVLHGT